VHPNSGSGLRRRACSLLGFAREDLNEGVVVTGSAEADAVATVVESLALSRPEKVNPGRSECRRRKTKDAHDEDHAQLYPLSYSSSSLTGTATLVSPPAFRRLLAENMAPLAGSAGAKFRKPRGCSAMSR
jgi:hypothetical protein